MRPLHAALTRRLVTTRSSPPHVGLASPMPVSPEWTVEACAASRAPGASVSLIRSTSASIGFSSFDSVCVQAAETSDRGLRALLGCDHNGVLGVVRGGLHVFAAQPAPASECPLYVRRGGKRVEVSAAAAVKLLHGDVLCFDGALDFAVELAAGVVSPELDFVGVPSDCLRYACPLAAQRDLAHLAPIVLDLAAELQEMGCVNREVLTYGNHLCNCCGVKLSLGAFRHTEDADFALCLTCVKLEAADLTDTTPVLTPTGVLCLDIAEQVMELPPHMKPPRDVPDGATSGATPPVVAAFMHVTPQVFDRCMQDRRVGIGQLDRKFLCDKFTEELVLGFFRGSAPLFDVKLFAECDAGLYYDSAVTVSPAELVSSLYNTVVPARPGHQLSDFPDSAHFPDLDLHQALDARVSSPVMHEATLEVCDVFRLLDSERNLLNFVPSTCMRTSPFKAYLTDGKSVTVLHVDASVAINGHVAGAGVAFWFVFKDEDLDALEAWVQSTYRCAVVPHREGAAYSVFKNNVILRDADFLALAAEGVHVHVVPQKCGEVIMVPAKFAHQVENCGPNLKLAADFVLASTLRAVLDLDRMRRSTIRKYELTAFNGSCGEDLISASACAVWGAFAALDRLNAE